MKKTNVVWCYEVIDEYLGNVYLNTTSYVKALKCFNENFLKAIDLHINYVRKELVNNGCYCF